MKKILLSIVALAFAAGVSTTFAAQHMKPGSDKVAAACKDKKAGDMVKVDGKDVKCPEKKDAKK